MKTISLKIFPFFGLALLLVSGCYFDRATQKYIDIPELSTEKGKPAADKSALDNKKGATKAPASTAAESLENNPGALLGKTKADLDREQEDIRVINELAEIDGEPIKAGEFVSIAVYGLPFQSYPELQVSEEGYIDFPQIGQVKVAGFTQAELALFAFDEEPAEADGDEASQESAPVEEGPVEEIAVENEPVEAFQGITLAEAAEKIRVAYRDYIVGPEAPEGLLERFQKNSSDKELEHLEVGVFFAREPVEGDCVVHCGDVLTVFVYGKPEIEKFESWLPVKEAVEIAGLEAAEKAGSAAGKIDFPGIGLLQAEGKTPVEFSQTLWEKLSQRLHNPKVEVATKVSSREIHYKVNPGDTLQIVVYDQPDLSDSNALVAPDGCIGLPLVGQFSVAGKTPTEAAAELEEKLKDYLVAPNVTISVKNVRSEAATINGAISSTGMYVINTGMRLADLFALAGGGAVRQFNGMWVDAADLKHSRLYRNGKQVHVNFNRAIKDADAVQNVLLRKDDYIYIASKEDHMVYLIGDVGSPQMQRLVDNMTLLQLLASCGWTKETYWDHAIIIRQPKEEGMETVMYKVDLGGILANKRNDVLIEAGDIVYLPKDDLSEFNVFVRKLMPTIQLIRGGRHLF